MFHERLLRHDSGSHDIDLTDREVDLTVIRSQKMNNDSCRYSDRLGLTILIGTGTGKKKILPVTTLE